jgi:hypothetical protein
MEELSTAASSTYSLTREFATKARTVISLRLNCALLFAPKGLFQHIIKRYYALATQLPDTMLACRPVVHIQPYKTIGAKRESFAQPVAQPLPPISQVLGEIHPPTYSRSTVPVPPTMTANPPTRHTTAFDRSSASQTSNLQGALEVVRPSQISRRTTLHTNTT